VSIPLAASAYPVECRSIWKYLARYGATQQEIAELLGISRMTVIRWSVQHPEFGQAIQAGNDVFNRRVERALAERAIGFYADQFTWRATTEQQRKQGKPRYELVPTGRTYYPPDVTAAIYWTKNRMPASGRMCRSTKRLVSSRRLTNGSPTSALTFSRSRMPGT
jgi:hypothetical protein